MLRLADFSVKRNLPAKARTGWQRFQVRVGSPSSVSTGRSWRFSTGPGSSMTSKRSSDHRRQLTGWPSASALSNVGYREGRRTAEGRYRYFRESSRRALCGQLQPDNVVTQIAREQTFAGGRSAWCQRTLAPAPSATASSPSSPPSEYAASRCSRCEVRRVRTSGA
jgi:hypothetical protein